MKIDYTRAEEYEEIEEVVPDADLEALALRRGISYDTLASAGIRIETEDSWAGGYPIRIPYPTLSGKVWYERLCAWPGSGVLPKYRTPPDVGRHLYNPHLVGPGDSLVWLAEGEFDCLALADVGERAMAIQGTNGFKGVWHHLFAGGTVVLAFDGDDAGVTAAENMKEKLMHKGIRTHVFSPPEGKDLNDLLKGETLADQVAEFKQAIDLR